MNPSPVITENCFVQFSFDNTDHNVQTLDGYETFHYLGRVAVYTPHYEIEYSDAIKKLKNMPSAQTLAEQNQTTTVPLREFTGYRLHNITMKSLESLQIPNLPILSSVNAAYLLGKYFDVSNFPSWKGFQELIF